MIYLNLINSAWPVRIRKQAAYLKNKKLTIICGVLIFAMLLMTSCKEIFDYRPNDNSRKLISSKGGASETLSEIEIENIKNSSTIRLGDDSPASVIWIPKAKNNTLSKVVLWLQQATVYNRKIPKSQISEYSFKANVQPSRLFLYSNEYTISIQPAYYLVMPKGSPVKRCYVDGVLQFKDNKQTCYIHSAQLFDWLKNDDWKNEFKLE